MVAIVSYAFGTVEKFSPSRKFKGFSDVWTGDEFDWALTSGRDSLNKIDYGRDDIDLYCFCGDITDYDKYRLRTMLKIDSEINFFGGERESPINALNYAIRGIESGEYKSAFVGASERRIEKCLYEKPHEKNLLRKEGEWEVQQIAQIKNQVMQQLEIDEKEFAGIAVKDHFQGVLNPAAQFQRAYDVNRIMSFGYVPDCGPLLNFEIPSENSCGAISLILVDDNEAKKHNPVYYKGFGESHQQGNQEILWHIPSMEEAIGRACFDVVNSEELNLLQIPDIGTPYEFIGLINTNLIHFSEAKNVLEKSFKNSDNPKNQKAPWGYDVGKEIFLNTDGGDKAAGRPGESTAYFRRIAETYQQLSGTADKRQIEKPEFAVTIQTTDWMTPEHAVHLWGIE